MNCNTTHYRANSSSVPGDPTDEPIVHFDLEGRWQRAFIAGIHELKGLDSTVQAIDRVREGPSLVLKRTTRSYAEATDLDATIRDYAVDLAGDLDAGHLEMTMPPASSKAEPLPPQELRDFLDRVIHWDAAAWFAHRERYQETYGPLPALPPDCPSALVLEATRAGVARSSAEFESHARKVSALLGRRIQQCKSVFLAGADVLRQPVDQVTSYLEIASRLFAVEAEMRPGRSSRALDGVSAVLDDFSPPVPDPKGLRRLSALGLKRVSLGIESGDVEIRRTHGKSWADDDLRATVAALASAGIGIGLIVAVGAGGIENATHHAQATASLIQSLDLKPRVLVSLLVADDLSALTLSPTAGRSAVETLSHETRAGLLGAMKARMSAVTNAKVAPFWLEKQGL